MDPAVSPNGHWVAFVSFHEGRGPRVYVKPSSGTGALYPVSNNAGENPFWSLDGKTLYYSYRTGAGSRVFRLMAADLDSSVDVDPDSAQTSFEVVGIKAVSDFWPSLREAHILPVGDSTTFLGLAAAPQRDASGEPEENVDDLAVIHVVRNFFTELERLAPTRNEVNTDVSQEP